MDKIGSQEEAKGNCSELDESSTLITIESLNEQNFIQKSVQKHNTLSDRVWIGLEWSDNTFKWMDGSEYYYNNVGEYSNYFRTNRLQINRCFQMSINGTNLGKWHDDFCGENYLMACQKKQASINNFQIDLFNQNKIIESQQTRLDRDMFLQNQVIDKQQDQINSLIPLGFIYTQLPDQSSPHVLWPNMKWTEVTQSYAGLFFRAEGNESLPFGQTQQANQSIISNYWCDSHKAAGDIAGTKLSVEIKEGWTSIYPQPHPAYCGELRLFSTHGDVRPRNTAVKIWKRTG